jgi:phosphotransacetylase
MATSRSSSPWPIPIRKSRRKTCKAVRDDAIMATGRSDYPNQVNNVLGFPYIFRGALDVRATTINDEMKIAAAEALAELAREDVPDEVAAAYHGARRVRPRIHHPGAVRSAPDLPQGALFRDCVRQVTYDRNIFAASMVAAGHADAMVTGVTRHYSVALSDVRNVIDPKPGERVVGVSIILDRGRTVFVGDTNVHEMPTSEELADITVQTAAVARRFGYEPRVALLAYSTFGQPWGERSQRVREAVELLDKRHVDFEYDGEMNADVALDMERMARYPFCRLKGPANVLIMPAIHSASISTTMTEVIGGATVIGPLLVGMSKSVQIAPLGAKMSDIVNMAALAAYNISN